MFPYGETVVILRPTVVLDRNGNEISGEPTEIPIEGCAAAHRESQEPDQYGRAQVVTGLQVFMPPGTDVRATDQLRVRGVVRDIDGEPFEWANPFTGWNPGVVVNLKGVSG